MRHGILRVKHSRFLANAWLFGVLTMHALNSSGAEELDPQEEIRQLRQQASEIMKRLEYLEAKLEARQQTPISIESPVESVDSMSIESATETLATGVVDVAGEKTTQEGDGLLELKALDTELTVGGRLTLDAFQMWPDTPLRRTYEAPLDGSGKNGQFNSHLRETRLWIKSRTPTRFGILRALVETDFAGTPGNEILTNSHQIRLRHAYFQLDGLTVGQTWSAFQLNETADVIVDPTIMGFIRQPQIRWSSDGGWLSYDVSVENPETTLTDPWGRQVLPSDDRWPDLVGRIRHQADWGSATMALMLRDIRQDKTTLSNGLQLDNTDSKLSWSTSGSALIKTWNKDDIRLGYVYGSGLGRYVAANTFSDATINTRGEIDLQTSWGAYAAYRHWWSPEWRSTVLYSMAATDNNPRTPGTANKRVGSWQANLFWMPIEDALFGLEYMRYRRDLENGSQGGFDMIYFRALYNF